MIEAIGIESANPTRHPVFQERLLGRTLLRVSCPECHELHLHYDRFLWTDLPGRLSVAVLREDELPDWPELEPYLLKSLSVPFREEGPPVVRELGAELRLRLAFGLEELREKVVCRIHGLDDRVIEAMKEELPYGATLEDAEPGTRLVFLEDGTAFDVPWDDYERTAADPPDLPGLFGPEVMWVNAQRSRREAQTLR